MDRIGTGTPCHRHRHDRCGECRSSGLHWCGRRWPAVLQWSLALLSIHMRDFWWCDAGQSGRPWPHGMNEPNMDRKTETTNNALGKTTPKPRPKGLGPVLMLMGLGRGRSGWCVHTVCVCASVCARHSICNRNELVGRPRLPALWVPSKRTSRLWWNTVPVSKSPDPTITFVVTQGNTG